MCRLELLVISLKQSLIKVSEKRTCIVRRGFFRVKSKASLETFFIKGVGDYYD